MSTPTESDLNPHSSSRRPQGVNRHWRIAGGTLAGLLILIAICAGATFWYLNTASFKTRVRQKLIGTIEQATGGRVDLKDLQWRILRLELEATDLTIHGLETPGELPYAHVDRVLVRVRILSLFRPSIRLSLLEAEHPVFHLIVNADGSTNQPTPKVRQSNKPVSDTLLDLAVERADISKGLVVVNERAIPFDLAANAIGVKLRYLPGKFQYLPGTREDDHYSATITVTDLILHRGKQAPVHSTLDLSLDLHRNKIDLQSLRLQTGARTLEASGTLAEFSHPEWKLAVNGKIDLREVQALGGVEGLERGTAEIHLRGASTLAGKSGSPFAGQPVTPSSSMRFVIDGNGRLEDGSYNAYLLNISGVDASAAVHVTEKEFRLNNVTARLRRGGTIVGTLRIGNWLGDAAIVDSAKSNRHGARVTAVTNALKAVAEIRARVIDVSLQTVLQMTAARPFRDVGFDTNATGDVTVDWTDSAADLTLGARLDMVPPSHLDAGEVPVTGSLDAKYFNPIGTVQITSLTAQTPATQLRVSGALGVYPSYKTSQLQGNLQTTNLGEFNKTLTDFGFTANGKTGANAIPVELHGQAAFQGNVTGTLADPDAKGQLTATNFGFVIPDWNSSQTAARMTTTASSASSFPRKAVINFDRLVAEGEYTSRLLSVQAATITHGTETIHLSGQLLAHQLNKNRWKFDEQSQMNAVLGIQKGSVAEVLALVGQSRIPVTGALDLNAHMTGSLDRMNGGGHLFVAGGEIYGEPYRSLNTDITLSGHQVLLSQLSLLQNGGTLTGEGSYDIQSTALSATAHGRGFELAHIRRAQAPGLAGVSGLLEFDASGGGTLHDPELKATAHLRNVVVGGEALGDLSADAHTEHHALRYTVDSNLKLAKMHINGETELAGLHETNAQLVFSKLDLEPLLRLAKVQGLTGHSSLAGTVSVRGPVAQPRQMNGEADLSEFAVNVAGVALKSEGRVHATLRGGTLLVDPLHITGDETNLTAQGSLDLLSPHDVKLHANGTVNVKLAESINPDVTASGHVEFGMDASGTFDRPSLTGQVKFVNVAMALQDLPNGLSQMNGTLQFNQDRLEVKSLTASTGGGQLALGGYITYQRGLYGDITAIGKAIRIRYPQGVSSVADANLHLQGQPANMLLSGSVLVTRFAISPDLDIAGLTGSANAVSALPDEKAPSNHVRLDVSIASAPQLNFQNSLAKLAGDVDLHVRGTVANPSVLGRVSITDGSATFAGTHYQLQRGDIYFTNPVRIVPNIDVDATARVEEYDINIGVHGTPSNLNVSYRSEPPLPQADVIALLAIGRTQEEQRTSSQQQSAGVNSGTDALLSGALNATLSNRVQKLFGGGSVKIDPSFVGTLGTSTARITIEQQVAKNVLVTYATNVNTTAQQLIQAQVDLTHNVSLVAVRDESGVFSMVLKVHKRIR